MKTDLQAFERKIELEERGEEPKKKGRFSRWWKWLVGGILILLTLLFGLFIFQERMERQRLRWMQGLDLPPMLKDGFTRLFKIPLIEIRDGRPGFVLQDTIKEMAVLEVFQVDVYLQGSGRKFSHSEQYHSYKYTGEELTLYLVERDSAVQLYRFNVKAQTSESFSKEGELIMVDKPALQGIYLFMKNDFYKIDSRATDTILSPVSDPEIALLKYYTEK